MRPLTDIKRIVVHTTDANWSITDLAQYDIGPNHISATGCPAITYADVVMDNGTIFHTLSYREVSWHVGVWNPGSVGIAMMFKCTDPVTKKDTYGPSEKQYISCYDHCAKLCLYLNLTPDKIVGHRELSGTGWFMFKGHKKLRKTCPGLKTDMDHLRTKASEVMQAYLRLKGYYKGKIDGDFGPLSKDALQRYRLVEDIEDLWR